jgi:hypothetical protein
VLSPTAGDQAAAVALRRVRRLRARLLRVRAALRAAWRLAGVLRSDVVSRCAAAPATTRAARPATMYLRLAAAPAAFPTLLPIVCSVLDTPLSSFLACFSATVIVDRVPTADLADLAI